MAESNLNWNSERQTIRKQPVAYGVDTLEMLTTQLDAINKKIGTLVVIHQPTIAECKLCGGPHPFATCPYNTSNSNNHKTANFISAPF